MRIGIVPILDRSVGGIYQYTATLLESLRELRDDEYVVFNFVGDVLPEDLELSGPAIPLRRGSGLFDKMKAVTARATHPGATFDPAWRRFFKKHGVELLIFTADTELAPDTGMPYVVAVHDIQHRLHPEFPEVSAEGEWERREHRLRAAIAGATVVLVDSEVGKEDLLAVYCDLGIQTDAVVPLPFLPAHYLADVDITPEGVVHVRETYGLPERYLFYPAQFWPHKNHKRIIEALSLLMSEGLRIPIVFVGTHSGEIREKTFKEVVGLARSLGVADLVHTPGYVPDEQMAALYAGAAGLVMPTFFGPTNIPILEAFQFSCPVITSDIRGIREQVGDAALLVDPESVSAIALAIKRLLNDINLRQTLVSRGHARLALYTQEDYLRTLRRVLDQAKRCIVRNGGEKP